MHLTYKDVEQFIPCIQSVGDTSSVEEYQAYGDMVKGKWTKEEKDSLNIWVGKNKDGKFYLGIAGRQPDVMKQGYHYFRTVGFQEISKEDYDAFIQVPAFVKTKD